jgi:hypothetical protein
VAFRVITPQNDADGFYERHSQRRALLRIFVLR